MTCGKRANPKAVDSLEKKTVGELLSLVRSQPEHTLTWRMRYGGARRRADLCEVLSSAPQALWTFRGEGAVLLKDIGRKHLIHPDRLIYKRTLTPLEDIFEDIWKVQKLAGLFDKDNFEVIMYNGFSDTFAIVSEGRQPGRHNLVEFKVNGKNQYSIVKSRTLSYTVGRSPDVKPPPGYIRLTS